MLSVDLYVGKGCGYLSDLGINAVGLEWTDPMAVLSCALEWMKGLAWVAAARVLSLNLQVFA